MLAEAAKFVTENPIIILVGFLCSIIGTIEMICSSVINLKTKKQKRKIEEKTKEIYEYLKGTAEFAETSSKLAKAKEELEYTRKQIDIDLPKERKHAIVIEQIKCEEQIINDANKRLQKLKGELETDIEKRTIKNNKLFNKIQEFVTTEKTRDFVILLLFLEAFLYFMNIIIGGILAKILGIASIVVALYYASKNYEGLRTETAKRIVTNITNIAVCLCFFDAFIDGNITGIIWWAILVLLLSFFRKTSNVIIDTIVPLLSIPLFIGVLIFSNCEAMILVTIIFIQIILIIINIIRIVRIIRNK